MAIYRTVVKNCLVGGGCKELSEVWEPYFLQKVIVKHKLLIKKALDSECKDKLGQRLFRNSCTVGRDNYINAVTTSLTSPVKSIEH